MEVGVGNLAGGILGLQHARDAAAAGGTQDGEPAAGVQRAGAGAGARARAAAADTKWPGPTAGPSCGAVRPNARPNANVHGPRRDVSAGRECLPDDSTAAAAAHATAGGCFLWDATGATFSMADTFLVDLLLMKASF